MIDYKQVNEAASMGQVLAAYGIEINAHNRAVCPFHDDHDPSMRVYEHSFYCFACGAGGDCIKFVQRMDSCSARVAAEKVAGISGGRIGRMDYRARRRLDESKKLDRRAEVIFDEKCGIIHLLAQAEYIKKTAEPFSEEWCAACWQTNGLEWELWLKEAEERKLHERIEANQRSASAARKGAVL